MFLMIFFTNFSDLIKPLMIWVTEFGFLCKLIVFILNGGSILNLVDEIKKPAYSKVPTRCIKSLEENVNLTIRLTNIYRLIIISFASYISLIKLFLNNKGERSLPLGAYIPCNLNNDACYISFAIFQSFNAYISSLTNINMECLFCKLITACCCSFDVLQDNLESIDYKNSKGGESDLRTNIRLHMKLIR